jgi:hypothetical protein
MLKARFVSAVLLALPSTALAFQPIDDDHRSIVLASGESVRPHINVEDTAPKSQPAWDDFLEAAGGRWYSMWDRETGVPVRIWGSGIAAPNSVASPAIAERIARGFVNQHLALLAPGASSEDFILAGNDLTDGIRSVGFYQLKNGVRVAG